MFVCTGEKIGPNFVFNVWWNVFDMTFSNKSDKHAITFFFFWTMENRMFDLVNRIWLRKTNATISHTKKSLSKSALIEFELICTKSHTVTKSENVSVQNWLAISYREQIVWIDFPFDWFVLFGSNVPVTRTIYFGYLLINKQNFDSQLGKVYSLMEMYLGNLFK